MSSLVAVVAGVASGIFFRSFFILPPAALGFVLIVVAILGVAWYDSRRSTHLLGVLFLLSAIMGIGRYALADSPLPKAFAADLRTKVSYTGKVVSDPDIREHNERITIEVKKGSAKTKLLAVASLGTEVSIGDTVSVYGTMVTPEPFSSDEEGGRIFRYDKYLQKYGVRFLINYATLHVLRPAPWYSAEALFAKIKHAFLRGIGQVMPEPYAALAGGVVIGGKRALGAELQNSFVISGLIPVVVLSGYNVMVAAQGIMYLLSFFKLRRMWLSFAGAIAVILFVLIAGLTSTAVRAALMAVIALYARATGRTYAAGRALLVVVLLMLLSNPLLLAFDPGFDLSVVATAGLIWLSPLFDSRLEKILPEFLKNIVGSTLAAQTAVLPLLLYQTGRLSLVAVPANLLVLPFIPLLMAGGAIAGIAGMLLGKFAFVLGLPAFLVSAYTIFIATHAAALSFASLTLPMFPFWVVLAAYAALGYIAFSKRPSTALQFTFTKKASI